MKSYILSMVVIDHKGDIETDVFPYSTLKELRADLNYMTRDTLKECKKRNYIVYRNEHSKYRVEIAYSDSLNQYVDSRWIWEIHTIKNGTVK